MAILTELLFLGMLAGADIGAGWPLDETVSELVYHDTSALAVAAFAVHAVSLMALGLALRGGPRVAAWLGALGMVLVSVFWADAPGTTSLEGRLHIVGAIFAFGGVASAAWMRRVQQPLVWLSLAVVANTLIVAGVAPEGGLVMGIFERLQVLLNGAWILVAAGWAPRRG